MNNTNNLTAQDLIDAANAAFADGDVATARQRLDAALTLDPRNAELVLAVGHFKLHAGDIPGALAQYTTAAQLLPRLATAHSSRALALVLLGHADEAEVSALEALTLKPHDSVALKVLTKVLLDRNRVDEAERIVTLVVQMHPEDQEAKLFLELIKTRRTMLRSGQLPTSLNMPGAAEEQSQVASSIRSADHLPPSTAGI